MGTNMIIGPCVGSITQGALLNYPEAIAKDGLGNIITPVEYNINGIDYVAHIFNVSGSFEVTKGGDVDYLIVGGGGSGGSYGGGGAGGLLTGKTKLAIGTFPVTVGNGGAAVTININGNNGQNSEAFGFIAIGGGGGAAGNDGGDAAQGGCGGGGGSTQDLSVFDNSCTIGASGLQGGDGGNGLYNQPNSSVRGAGGGGAGASGSDASTNAGNGGIGVASDYSGVSQYYSGGGGGGMFHKSTGNVGNGGNGGGGAGNGIDATINTGGGGGGARPAPTSGKGGSGIVIVRYKKKITPYNIFLVAGQSNTDGRVATTTEGTPDYLTDNKVDNVKAWNGSALVDYDLTDIGQSGNGSSWISADSSGKYSFAHVALKKIAEEMDNVIICQVTQGSSPLAAVSNIKGSWNYDYEAIPVGTPKLLESLENRFNALKSYLNSINRTYVVRGILFHQGEWDDDIQFNEEDQYEVNFTQLVSVVRNFTGKSTLPFMYGTVPITSAANSAIIKAVHTNFADNDANAYCRDNDDLTLFDSYHLDANSCNVFGEWCAIQFLNNYT